jgi:hypothetical protein
MQSKCLKNEEKAIKIISADLNFNKAKIKYKTLEKMNIPCEHYNFTEDEKKIFQQIMRYKGMEFDKCRLGNPCLTKRDTIYLANAIEKIINCLI